jgi:hypothetical protein
LSDWTQEDAEVPGNNNHLWEESWDDDDTSEDFSAQLKWVDGPNSGGNIITDNVDWFIGKS